MLSQRYWRCEPRSSCCGQPALYQPSHLPTDLDSVKRQLHHYWSVWSNSHAQQQWWSCKENLVNFLLKRTIPLPSVLGFIAYVCLLNSKLKHYRIPWSENLGGTSTFHLSLWEQTGLAILCIHFPFIYTHKSIYEYPTVTILSLPLLWKTEQSIFNLKTHLRTYNQDKSMDFSIRKQEKVLL